MLATKGFLLISSGRRQSNGLKFRPLLVHPLPLHPLKPLANPGLNNLALLLFLGVFKETLVAKVHEMSRLVDLALEAAEGQFDGFSLSYIDFDVGVEGGSRGD